ncbi:hypothetical protein [Klebsiella aerogenes]|uniref:hypothetical protein n=1 Tax=Klebsiella aerogenes TaxID=548 RepID=UPI001F36C208|nr:hypothetical protein [Klebsiella aerogenes]
MASKSQKFNASVNFGATVDPSMTRTLNRLTSGIDRIGTETAQVNRVQTAWQRNMKAGAASTANQLKHMERATQALINKHEALEKEIRDSVKNGRAGTAFLIEDYKKVGAAIERARKETERLNHEQERENKIAERERRRKARAERFSGALFGASKSAWARMKAAPGNMLESGLSMVGGLPFAAAKMAITAPVAIAKAGIVAGTGIIGSVIALNHKTAEEYRLAQQYGMSYRKYKTGSILAEQAGLNGENYGDLSEELSNKLGEQGNDKTINPMLWQLGIAGKAGLKGTKQQQFDTVMQKISKAVLSGDMTAQEGESLADQLMGGEANKLMTYIISTGKSYEEVMKNAEQLNNVSEDEARGALESSQILSNLWTSAETAMQGIAGELGKAFRPQLEAWEKQATAWIGNNKKLIVNAVTDWVNGGGPQRIVHNLEVLAQGLSTVVNWIEDILPETDERTPAQMASVQEARQRAIEMEEKRQGVNSLGYQESIASANAGERAWRDARSKARVPDGVTFDDSVFGGLIPTLKTQNNLQTTNHVNITVNALPGQSAEDIGLGAYNAFKRATPDISFPSGANTFDAPEF